MGFLIATVAFAYPVFAKEETANHTQFSDVYVVANASQTLKMGSGGEEYASSCISYAKFVLGVHQSIKWGNAKDLKPTVEKPYIGGLVLTKEGQFGHVAVIVNMVGDSLQVKEANYVKGKITTRELSVDSPVIRWYR